MRLNMEDFATYILEEKDYIQKMIITYYLSKKTGIFFDKSIVLRTEIAKLFIDYAKLNLDKNLVLTAVLLCNCKKVDDLQKIGKLETYAKEGAEYLSTLGFNKRFCKICEELNRYSKSEPREPESDFLEVIDQFTGLILNRPERPAFSPEEALVILKERNLKDVDNRYLNDLIVFVKDMENICVKETIDVPVIKKLISLHNNSLSVKSFISTIGNEYDKRISDVINKSAKNQMQEIYQKKTYKRVRYTKEEERPLFSKEIAERVLNHKSVYKIEE